MDEEWFTGLQIATQKVLDAFAIPLETITVQIGASLKPLQEAMNTVVDNVNLLAESINTMAMQGRNAKVVAMQEDEDKYGRILLSHHCGQAYVRQKTDKGDVYYCLTTSADILCPVCGLPFDKKVLPLQFIHYRITCPGEYCYNPIKVFEYRDTRSFMDVVTSKRIYYCLECGHILEYPVPQFIEVDYEKAFSGVLHYHRMNPLQLTAILELLGETCDTAKVTMLQEHFHSGGHTAKPMHLIELDTESFENWQAYQPPVEETPLSESYSPEDLYKIIQDESAVDVSKPH